MLPTSILAQAENHPCFSGCYSSGNQISTAIGPTGAMHTILDVQCQDCLSFRLGIDVTLLPSGTSTYKIADELTSHMRTYRGYALSTGGYHTQGSGFWLSAAYWAQAGLFILGNTRGSGNNKPPLDVLIEAVKTGLIANLHPNLTDPNQYICQDVYLSVVPPPSPMSMNALLNSSHVSTQRKLGYVPVTLAEFQPISKQALAVLPPAPLQPAPGPTPAQPSVSALLPFTQAQEVPKSTTQGSRTLGSTCEVCGETICERLLFSSTYIGCKCG